MDRSEDERRPAQRAGDQSESEGSRGVSQPSANVTKPKRERRLAGPRSGPETRLGPNCNARGAQRTERAAHFFLLLR